MNNPNLCTMNPTHRRVQHNYHDHASDSSGDYNNTLSAFASKTEQPFPAKLHFMLDDMEKDGQAHIISWAPHGRCFIVHDKDLFIEQILGSWFRQTKIASFQRQLNIYGFSRLTKEGPDKGGYFHEMFLRGKPGLALKIQRIKLKGTKTRCAASPESEPNFYAMPPLPQTNTNCSRNLTSVQRAMPLALLASPNPTFQEGMSSCNAPIDLHGGQFPTTSVSKRYSYLEGGQELAPLAASSSPSVFRTAVGGSVRRASDEASALSIGQPRLLSEATMSLLRASAGAIGNDAFGSMSPTTARPLTSFQIHSYENMQDKVLEELSRTENIRGIIAGLPSPIFSNGGGEDNFAFLVSRY